MPRLRPDLSRQSQFLDCTFLFPNVKTAFKGRRFQDVEGIKKNMTAELNAVPLEASVYSFQKRFKQFNKCTVTCTRDYRRGLDW
jgi:hypothetical protein